TSFKGASLREARLSGARAGRAMFVRADMHQAQCQGGLFPQSLWADASVEGVDFSGDDLSQAIFHRARCRGAVFSHAALTYADFSYADLREADLREGRFMRTQLHRAVTLDARWTSRAGILENDPHLYEAELWSAARPTAGRAGPGAASVDRI